MQLKIDKLDSTMATLYYKFAMTIRSDTLLPDCKIFPDIQEILIVIKDTCYIFIELFK